MDGRFDTSKDPRFKKVPRHVRKVSIDKRFAHMFTDKSFVESSKVDARGDRVASSAGSAKLREFYDLADADSASLRKKAASVKTGKAEKDVEAKPKRKKKKRKGEAQDAAEDEDTEDDDAEERPPAQEEAADESGDDASDASGEGGEGDESSTDIDVSDVESDHGMDESIWDQVKEQEAVPRGDATPRLAVMGCDWDHVSAGELLVVLRNYLKGQESQKAGGGLRTGNVLKVTIYPSEYGLAQMALENKSGPQALNVVSQISLEPHGGDEEANEKRQNEEMRKYQFQRAKYYYAVATCDSAATASWLYDRLDSMEVDGICQGMMDLRFIPDDIEFPHKPKSEATELPKRYQGPATLNKAQGQTKVKCTWDETPASRKKDLMRKSFTPGELEDMDLEEYLASTSGEDDSEPTEDKKSKKGKDLRASLGLGDSGDEESDARDLKAEGFDDSDGEESDEQPKMGDMEMTFNVAAEKLEEDLAERVDAEGSGEKKLKEKEGLSPWDAYLQKRKEKRSSKKADSKAKREAIKKGEDPDAEKETEDADQVATKDELQLLVDDEGDDKNHFNLRGRIRQAAKKAGKEKDGTGFTVDTSDLRFKPIFDGAQDFEIDPTHPEFRPSEGMRKVLKAKRDKKKAGTAAPAATSAKAPLETVPEKAASERLRTGPAGGGGGFGGLQLFAGSKRKAEAPAPSKPKAEGLTGRESLLDASTKKKKQKKVARGARA